MALRHTLRVAAPCAKRSFVTTTKPKKDPHAFVVWSSVVTMAQVTNNALGKGWIKKLVEDEPVVFFSCLLGFIGILMPVTVVPIRRRLGYDTSQYDGLPSPMGGH